MATIGGVQQHRPALDIAAAAPMLAQVERWSAVNSGSHNPAGLAAMAGLIADAASGLPGAIALHDAIPAETIDAAGRPVTRATGRSLLLTVRPDAPVQVLLTGHMDTVFAADDPFQATRWREPGILNGPGVADMKGGIAVMLAALAGVEASPLAPRLGYQMLINADEEVGSPGSAPLIARCAQGKAAALTYEPATLPDGTLAGARPGSGNFSLVIAGRAAHAGRNPADGRNALVAAADLALRLARATGPGLTVNPARIDGGSANNVVPDHAVLRVNMRPATPADAARAQATLDDAVTAVAAAHDVGVRVHGGFGRPPKPLTAEAERLYALVAACSRALGREIGWRPTGGVCDGNNIAACGIPVVDTMGVRGGAIHSAEEYLIVESLGERAMLSTLVLLSLAEHGRP